MEQLAALTSYRCMKAILEMIHESVLDGDLGGGGLAEMGRPGGQRGVSQT